MTTDDRRRIRHLRLISITELLLWVLSFNFAFVGFVASPFVEAARGVSVSPQKLLISLAALAAVPLFSIVLGVILEAIRFWLFRRQVKVHPIPEEVTEELDSALAAVCAPLGIKLTNNRLGVVLSDLSMGAHVRGVLYQQVQSVDRDYHHLNAYRVE